MSLGFEMWCHAQLGTRLNLGFTSWEREDSVLLFWVQGLVEYEWGPWVGCEPDFSGI